MTRKRKKGPAASIQRLAKWRGVFVGWQLGTLGRSDPEAMAVRDHREVTTLMRAEINALTRILLEARVMTEESFVTALGAEAEQLSEDYARRFPGFTAEDDGISINPELARETTKDWKP